MDLALLSAVLVGAGCLALGYYIGARYPARIFISARLNKDSAVAGNRKKKDKPKEPLEIEQLADILEDFKMVALSLSHTFTNTEKANLRIKNLYDISILFSLFFFSAGFGCEEWSKDGKRENCSPMQVAFNLWLNINFYVPLYFVALKSTSLLCVHMSSHWCHSKIV